MAKLIYFVALFFIIKSIIQFVARLLVKAPKQKGGTQRKNHRSNIYEAEYSTIEES